MLKKVFSQWAEEKINEQFRKWCVCFGPAAALKGRKCTKVWTAAWQPSKMQRSSIFLGMRKSEGTTVVVAVGDASPA